MREMHKWKDKVELSLDNRQIFFLFFGLSVVGCFVFALGVMVGRRVDFRADGEVAALSQESLALLEAVQDEENRPFDFPKGLEAPAPEVLPQARELGPIDADVPTTAPSADGEPAALAASDRSTAVKTQHVSKASVDPSKVGRAFTLQFKAFSREEEAATFAEKLRRNGHDVRVEAHEIRGRLWHRVRMGSFTEWDAAVTAKTEFEKQEHLIAYVVRE